MVEKLRSVAPGVLKLGTVDVECHVLSDGRRVLLTKQVRSILSGGAPGNKDFGRTLSRIPNASSSLMEPPRIEFALPHGGRLAVGYEASFLIDVCAAFQKALLAGVIADEKQRRVASQASVVLSACAKVGILALIDEATGYQSIRAANELAQQLGRYLREDAAQWVQVFTEDLDYAMCKLRRKPPQRNPVWMRGDIGRIYEIIHGKTVMRALRKRNPQPRNRSNHHQYFAELVQRGMKSDLEVVRMFARTSKTVDQFYETLRVHFRGAPLQMELPTSAPDKPRRPRPR